MKAPGTVEMLFRSRGIADIDRHFAALVAELAKCPDDVIPLAAALASALTREGHTCVDLEELAGSPWPGEDGIVLPDRESWLAALETSPVVRSADSKERAPLVLAGRRRLYLERLHVTGESRLRPGSGDSAAIPSHFPTASMTVLERHFPGTSPDGLPRAAAKAALSGRFCCISGGPGTGKTTIVAKILSLFLDAGLVSVSGISLTAPTGKAAARLQQAVRGALKKPDASAFAVTTDPPLALRKPQAPGIDGYSSSSTRPRWWISPSWTGCSKPFPVMQGSSCWAIPPSWRPCSQAPSSPICAAAARVRGIASPFPGCRAPAQLAFQQDGRRGDGFAEAIRKDDADAIIDALYDPHDDEISLQASPGDRRHRQTCRRADGAALRAPGAQDAVRSGGRFRSLQALPGPVRTPSRTLSAQHASTASSSNSCRDRGLTGSRDGFYVGRPIIVTRNDPRLGLSNGDTGIVFPGAPGERHVLFPDLRDNKGMALVVPIGRLPDHESFFAVTVHRAQGSEYDEVVIIPGPAEFTGRHPRTSLHGNHAVAQKGRPSTAVPTTSGWRWEGKRNVFPACVTRLWPRETDYTSIATKRIAWRAVRRTIFRLTGE